MKGVLLIVAAITLVVLAIVSVDTGLYVGYALLIGAIASAIVLPLLNILQSPGEIKKALFALVGMVILFGISYFLSGDEVSANQAAKGISHTTVKLVGAGLTMFYLVSGIAVVGLIYSEINKAFK